VRFPPRCGCRCRRPGGLTTSPRLAHNQRRPRGGVSMARGLVTKGTAKMITPDLVGEPVATVLCQPPAPPRKG